MKKTATGGIADKDRCDVTSFGVKIPKDVAVDKGALLKEWFVWFLFVHSLIFCWCCCTCIWSRFTSSYINRSLEKEPDTKNVYLPSQKVLVIHQL